MISQSFAFDLACITLLLLDFKMFSVPLYSVYMCARVCMCVCAHAHAGVCIILPKPITDFLKTRTVSLNF